MQFNHLEIYPTDNCKLKCYGCILHARKRSLSERHIEKIVKSGILKRVRKSVTILGGEPTMWKKLLMFIPICRRENKHIDIVIVSNGLNWNRKLVETCKRNRVLVDLSYHGIDISRTVGYLKKNRILRKIIFVPSKYNYKTIDDDFRLYSSLANCVYRPFIGGKDMAREVELYNKVLKDVEYFRPVESSIRRINDENLSNIDIINKCARKPDFLSKFMCRCGKHGVIYTDGKLYHCLSDAMKGINYLPMTQKNDFRLWKRCRNEVCSCDTFNLKTGTICMSNFL